MLTPTLTQEKYRTPYTNMSCSAVYMMNLTAHHGSHSTPTLPQSRPKAAVQTRRPTIPTKSLQQAHQQSSVHSSPNQLTQTQQNNAST